MAVHCRGKRLIHLHDKSIITSAKEDMEEIQEVNMSIMKVVADAEASRNIDMLLACKVASMCHAVFLFKKSCLLLGCLLQSCFKPTSLGSELEGLPRC